MAGVIKINPEIFSDKRDAHAVAWDEALRLWMEDTGFEPAFEVTPEQEEFFRGTAYAEGEGTSAEKGGNVLGKLDPATWGGGDGKAGIRADTRSYRETHPLKELRSDINVPTLDEIIGVQESGNTVVDTVNRVIGAATTFGPAAAAVAGAGSMGGLVRAANASTGAPALRKRLYLQPTQPQLAEAIAAEEQSLFRSPGVQERISNGGKRAAHAMGGEVTQAALKKYAIKYDISEAHKKGEALYSDIGAYAGGKTAGFEAVSKAISIARSQRRLLDTTGLDPNADVSNQFILSAYTANPAAGGTSRPGLGNSRLRYVINPVSPENIIAAYNTDVNTGSVRGGANMTEAEAFLESRRTGAPAKVMYYEPSPQVKAPIAGLGGTLHLQPSIADSIKNKRTYNEIVVRPQIGDFYIEDTDPSAGALPAKLRLQMKRLRQAYRVAHRGSSDPFAPVGKILPNSFNPGIKD